MKASGGSSTFRAYAIGDKVLTKDGLRYLLFYDFDGRFPAGVPLTYGNYRVFPTPNGFHAIGSLLGPAWLKQEWFRFWRAEFPSDYRLANLNWLAPHSRAELDFILDVSAGAELLKCHYYRDKAVFEEWLRLHD